MLQGSVNSKPSKYNMYTPEERVKMKRYTNGTTNGPAKAAGHFSQLLDGKLP